MFSLLALTALACGTPLQASSPVLPAAFAPGDAQGVAVTLSDGRSRWRDPELEALWSRGVALDTWIARAERRRDVWEESAARATLPRDVVERMAALEELGSWRLLVIAADWCLDSANNVPPMARLAESSSALDLRIVSPADGGQPVMEARRTPDGRAATPTVVVLNARGEEVGCWIERPARQQDFYQANLKGVEEGSDAYRAAVRDFLGWYREDNGASTLRELLTVLETAAVGGPGGCSNPSSQ